MFQRFSVVVAALITVVATLAFSPATAGAVDVDWDFYADWGVTDLATDRQTVNNIYVYEIENINGTVYIAGAFEKVVHRDAPDRPIDQAFLVAFDAASGDIVSSFRPEFDHPVYAVAEHPTTGSIVVGGEFTRVNGVDRTSLVALDPETGETDPSFTGTVRRTSTTRRSVVRGIDTDGTSIFVGGSFGRANGTGGQKVRHNVAKFDAVGRVDNSWNVNVSGGGVWDLVVSSNQSKVIFGGLLSGVNGVSRPGLAMVAASNGTVTGAFPDWRSVGDYCYGDYPGCLFIYDLDVQAGRLLVSGGEHFSSLHNDETGSRLHMWNETNDTQAGLLDDNYVWRTRHGDDNDTGMYYAHDLNTYEPLVTTVDKAGTGPGGFEMEKGENGCVWIGGSIGGMDLARSAGTSKVRTFHVGFMCPPGTGVPESQLTIDNWETSPGLQIRRFVLESKGQAYGVFSYTSAPDAIKHEVFLDGQLIGLDDDGSFAFSHLEQDTTYQVEVRATDNNARTSSAVANLRTDPLDRPRLDTAAGVAVSQLDQNWFSDAEEANDEDLDTYSRTNRHVGSWWEMDLGSVQQISVAEIWAREGDEHEAANVHVMVSDQPFTSDDLSVNQLQASVDVFLSGQGQHPATALLHAAGRYIRFQSESDEHLLLAEVDVWGAAAPNHEVVPHPNPFVIPNLNVHRFREVDSGYTYGVFAYDSALDATGHEVYLDGELMGTDDDGSFAFSQLQPGTDYEVTLRSVGVNGLSESQSRTLSTRRVVLERLDLTAGVSVSQIDQNWWSGADQANDENLDSYSRTNRHVGSWWEIDLGSVQGLSRAEIWARDGEFDEAANVHVLVADQPFTSDDLSVNQAHASADVFLAGDGQRPASAELSGSGRYIRLQSESDEHLRLAEVDIWGSVDVAGEVVPHPDPFVVPNLVVRDFVQSAVGHTYGVFSYDPAPGAVRHEVYLDGELIGTDDDGSFAFSHLEAGATYDIRIRAVDGNGIGNSEVLILMTERADRGHQLDVMGDVSTSQRDQYGDYESDWANDSDLGTFSHTERHQSSWWEIDLGLVHDLNEIEIWARSGRLDQSSDLHVLVSETPFVSDDLSVNQARATVDVFLAGEGQLPATVELSGSGRYIRLHSEADEFLALAEINVWGATDAAAEVVPHANPFVIANLADTRFRQTAIGYTYGVFAYESAADATKHKVFLDGVHIGDATGGTFAISVLDPETTYQVKLVAEDGQGNSASQTQTLITRTVVLPRLDTAVGVVASQLDQNWGSAAGEANDENLDTYSRTNRHDGSWWEMDLGSIHDLSRAEIWARNGDLHEAANLHVMVSDQPFTSDELAANQAHATVDVFLAGDGQRPASAELNVSGRYIRLQSESDEHLRLAEVDVWGTVDVNGEVAPHPNPLPGGVIPPPPDGNLVCELVIDGTSIDVNWTGATSADSIIIYRTPDGGNKHWRGKVSASDGTFTDTLGNAKYRYELLERTGNHFGGSFDCGDTDVVAPPPPPPPAGLICEVDDVNGEALVEWSGQAATADSIVIYRTPDGASASWRGKVDATESSFTDSLGDSSYAYQVREKTGNVSSDFVDCGTVTKGPVVPPPVALTCTVANVGGEAIVTVVGQSAADWVIIYRSVDGGTKHWRGKIDPAQGTFTDSLNQNLFDYEIRERTGNTNSDSVLCGSVQG